LKFAYHDKKTSVHRLHPVCIIIWVLAVFIGSIILTDPILLLLLFLSTIPFVIIGRILREWSSFIKLAFFLSLLIILINILASQHGSTILVNVNNIPILGTLNITLESIVFGILMSIRLLATISAFAILTLIVNPDNLLQTILLLKAPYRTVFTTSIATRFIPCLLTDVNTIQDSLKSRAYQMNNGNILSRIKKRTIILPALLSNSLERSIQSAEAMEARGFGTKTKRTFYKTIQTTKFDIFFIILSVLLFASFILMWMLNIGAYAYYPTLSPISITYTYIFIVLLVVFMISAPAMFSPLKRRIDLD